VSPPAIAESPSASPDLDATPPARSWDLTRILLAVVAIGGLIAASFWVLRPFLPAVIWATMIVVATWPALRAVEARLWRRRSLAVVVMTLAMLAILAVPLTMGVVAIVERADDVVTWSRALAARPLPGLPDWVAGLPLVGQRIAAEWQKLASTSPDELAARVTPYLRDIARWLIVRAGGVGALLLQFLLTVVVAAMLYAKGEAVTSGVLAFARRLAGEDGVRVAILSAGAIRAVALGIVVTALVQSAIGGIGLAVTGVPHAFLLTCVMVMLGVAQIGPAPVLLGGLIWLYASGETFWGTVLLVWALVTASLDNILRPILIRKGADLPLVLVIAGVLGGLLAFGLIGLFVGPVVLAVTYTLLLAWVRTGEPAPHASATWAPSQVRGDAGKPQ
jgi:predicted PurR-regulated permease PerM